MGNHKLRKQASEALKKAGAPKLFKPPVYGKRYGTVYGRDARQLRLVAHMASLKPGDIVFDCDGFNHRIKSFKWSRLWMGLVWVNQYEFEDSWSCGCMVPEPAKTPAEINAIWLDNWTNRADEINWSEYSDKEIQARDDLFAGKSLVDDLGFQLPKYKNP